MEHRTKASIAIWSMVLLNIVALLVAIFVNVGVGVAFLVGSLLSFALTYYAARQILMGIQLSEQFERITQYVGTPS